MPNSDLNAPINQEHWVQGHVQKLKAQAVLNALRPFFF
jgi:hypothetical protein